MVGLKERPLTDAQRALVVAYAAEWPDPVAVVRAAWPDVWRMARASGLDDLDVRSAAWAGVVRAAAKFDPARGVTFATYASHWMRGYLSRACRRTMKAGRWTRFVSGDQPARGADGEGDLWNSLAVSAPADPAGDPAERDRLGEIRRRLAASLRFLPGPYRRVIDLRFGLDGGGERTLEDVAAVLGVTRERVRQLEARAFERVRVPLQLTCAGLVGGRPVRDGHGR